MNGHLLEKGTQLAGYKIDGILGQGGMGVVYEATQVTLNRKVALKVLAPHLSDDVLFRERFRREGQLQAGLDHPHIVTVHEAGDSDEGVFIAMQLIRGPNLKDMIVSRELDPGRTIRILTPIAEALDDAHEGGLIHRDIKPQNILVAGRDHAFLADFGLTKGPGEKSLTRTGQFVGTFDYISPEQVKGERATHQSDVYALAAVLYECLTGIVPFPKDSEAAVLYAQMAEPPPKVTDQRPELSVSLDQVIEKGMAKDPAERYDTCGQLFLETRRSFTQRTRAAFTPPRPLEVPQETGIRPPEADVPTREGAADDGPPPTVPAAPEPTAPAPEPTAPAAEPTAPAAEPTAPAAAAPTAAAAGAGAAAAEPTAAASEGAAPAAKLPGAAEPPDAAAPTAAAGAPALPEAGPGAAETIIAPEAAAAPTAARAPGAPASVPPTAPAPTAPGTAGMPRQRTAPTAAGPRSRAESPRAPERSRLGLVLAGVALLGAVVLAGLLIGRSTAGSDDSTPTSSNVSSAGPLELSYPDGWQRAQSPPKIPGLTLRNAIAISKQDGGGNGALLAGTTNATGPGLLPAALLDRLGDEPPRNDAVRLGDLDAYRYRNLRPEGFDGRVTVYAAPTTAGVATVACTAPSAEATAFLPDCENVADGLKLVSGEKFALGADKDYLARLDETFARLNRERTGKAAALRTAKTQGGQSAAAAALAGSYAGAAKSLQGGSVSPAVREAARSLREALARVEAAYRRLSAAAKSGNQGAYRAAKEDVQHAEQAVESALRDVRAAGSG
jgi:Protein kinase domain